MKLKNLLLGCLSTLLLGTGIAYSGNIDKKETKTLESDLKSKKIELTSTIIPSDKTSVVETSTDHYTLNIDLYDFISIADISTINKKINIEFPLDLTKLNYIRSFKALNSTYDPALREIIPGANEDYKLGPVLNDRFFNFRSEINDDLKDNDFVDSKITRFFNKHADNFNGNTKADTVIAFTHPFYLQLSDFDRVKSNNVKKELDTYLTRFFNLLKNIPRDRLISWYLKALHIMRLQQAYCLKMVLLTRFILQNITQEDYLQIQIYQN